MGLKRIVVVEEPDGTISTFKANLKNSKKERYQAMRKVLEETSLHPDALVYCYDPDTDKPRK